MAEILDLSEYSGQSDKTLSVVMWKDYQLPAFVRQIGTADKTKKLWVVWPAMDLRQKQFITFFNTLEPYAHARQRSYLFFKELPDPKILKPVPGCTPQYWYRWLNDPPAEGMDALDGETAEIIDIANTVDEEFLREIVRRTQILDLPKLKIFWAALIQVSMQWMVNKQRPLHLGFATVFAVPYRTNWKSILLAFFPKSFSACNKSGPKSEEAMERIGITRHFRSRELLELTPEHTVNWKLELVPTRMWQQCVEKVERLRIGSGKEAYAKFIARSIVRLQKHIAASYRHFTLRAAAPAGKVQQLAVGNNQALIPNTPRGGIRPRAIAPSSTVICADTSSDSAQPTLVSLIEREIDEVSRLPNLQSQLVELRISGNHVQIPEKSGG